MWLPSFLWREWLQALWADSQGRLWVWCPILGRYFGFRLVCVCVSVHVSFCVVLCYVGPNQMNELVCILVFILQPKTSSVVSWRRTLRRDSRVTRLSRILGEWKITTTSLNTTMQSGGTTQHAHTMLKSVMTMTQIVDDASVVECMSSHCHLSPWLPAESLLCPALPARERNLLNKWLSISNRGPEGCLKNAEALMNN